MNQQQPQRTLLRTPTAMRAAFEAGLRRAIPRALRYAHYDGCEDPNLPTMQVVSTALTTTAGLRKAPAWRATRKGPPQR